MRRHPLPLLDIGSLRGGLERFFLVVSLWGGLSACEPVPDGADVDVSLKAPEAVSQDLTLADCPAGYNIIEGTSGADTITGTSGPDCILGYGGDDTIEGGGGDDIIDGGDDDDVIHGGDGDDTLHGGGGNDTIYGGAGSDTISGEGQVDHIYGGDGDDVIDGGEQEDFLYGEAGDDEIHGGQGEDTIDGGDGDDDLYGDRNNDIITGGYGNDTIDGGNGNNAVDGGPGIDDCTGTNCEPGVTPLTLTPTSLGPVRRDEVPAWPAGWFISDGDQAGDASGSFDLTDVASAYPTVDGQEYLALRYQLSATGDDVADRVGVAGYLDVDYDGEWDARFATIRTEALGGPGTGSAVVAQVWDGSAWGPLTLLSWTDASDDALGARGADALPGPCPPSDPGCEGWLFDGGAELAPSHPAADRTGVVSLALPLADLGLSPGDRPRLWTGVYDTTVSLTTQGLTAMSQILDEGGTCNDPLAPLPSGSGCAGLPWNDFTNQPLQTPATLEEIDARPDGFSFLVTALRGPTWLELWRVSGREVVPTRARAEVTQLGQMKLTDPEGARGPYLLVDRGIEGIAAVFDAQGPVRDEDRPRALFAKARGVPTAGAEGALRSALSAPAVGFATLPARSPPGEKLSGWLVDVPRAGGLVVLPKQTGEGPVAALWVEGARVPAWPCGADRACALVAPPDPSRPAPWRRAGLVEHGEAPLLAEPPAPATAARPAPLLTRHRLTHPESWSGWNAPLEHLEALGYTWRPYVAQKSVSLANTGEGALLAFEARVLSWHELPSLEHAVALSSGGETLAEARFFGRKGRLRLERAREDAFSPASLTLGPVDGAGSIEEALLFVDAFVERARAPVVEEGPLVAWADAGGLLSLQSSAPALFVVVRGAFGERAFVVEPGAPFAVSAGDLVAASPLAELAGAAMTTPVRAATASSAFGKEVVVVLGAGAGDLEAATAALQPWLKARDPSGERIAVVSSGAVQASWRAQTDERAALTAFLRALRLSRLEGGDVTVILVGAATDRVTEVPLAGGLRVASGLSFVNGYNAMSDAKLARTASGAPLPGVVVARLPLPGVAALSGAAVRLAAEAERERPLDRLAALGDSQDAFTEEVEAAVAQGEAAGLLAAGFDGYLLGQSAARTGALGVLEEGSPLLWFVGHGSPRAFGGGLVSGATLDTFYRDTEEEAGAVLVGLTCLVGHLSIPGESNRVAQRLFSDANARVRAAIVGAGFLDEVSHDLFGPALLSGLVAEGATVGQAFLSARENARAQGASEAALDAYALLGDPLARAGRPSSPPAAPERLTASRDGASQRLRSRSSGRMAR